MMKNAMDNVLSLPGSIWTQVCKTCHDVRVKAGVAMEQIKDRTIATCRWVKARAVATLTAIVSIIPTMIKTRVAAISRKCGSAVAYAYNQTRYAVKLTAICVTAFAVAIAMQVSTAPQAVKRNLDAMLAWGSTDCSPAVQSELKVTGDRLSDTAYDSTDKAIKFGAAAAVGAVVLKLSAFVFGAAALTSVVVASGVILLVSAAAAFAIVAATAAVGTVGLTVTAKLHGEATESFVRQAMADPKVVGALAAATAC